MLHAVVCASGLHTVRWLPNAGGGEGRPPQRGTEATRRHRQVRGADTRVVMSLLVSTLELKAAVAFTTWPAVNRNNGCFDKWWVERRCRLLLQWFTILLLVCSTMYIPQVYDVTFFFVHALIRFRKCLNS